MLRKLGQQMLRKLGQQMLRKLGQQTLTKIGQQLFHIIATDARLAGANQQMFLTYTIDYVTPDRFFCLRWYTPLYHYLRILHYSFINHHFHHSTITIKQKIIINKLVTELL